MGRSEDGNCSENKEKGGVTGGSDGIRDLVCKGLWIKTESLMYCTMDATIVQYIA